MKKILFVFVLLASLLVACTEQEESIENVETTDEVETITTGPTQDELNAKLKSEATEITFAAANGDEISKDSKVMIKGVVTNISKEGVGGVFTVTTSEDDGVGMYSVINFSTSDVNLNSEVTVCGTYNGKDEIGFPAITATIIE